MSLAREAIGQSGEEGEEFDAGFAVVRYCGRYEVGRDTVWVMWELLSTLRRVVASLTKVVQQPPRALPLTPGPHHYPSYQ